MNLCWGGGCYCKQGFLWDKSIKECLDEKECGKHNEDYLERKLADGAADDDEDDGAYDDYEYPIERYEYHSEIETQPQQNITPT